MSVQFYWDNPEKTIVRYEFVGKWTWEELYETFYQSWDEISRLSYTVDSISDFSQTTNAPPSVMTHVRKLSQSRPENTGTMVIVDANNFLTMMLQTFSKLLQSTLRRQMDIQAVKTLAEGRALLAQIQSERNKPE